MESPHKKNKRIVALPVIRHLRAITKLILLFFWQNLFDSNTIIHPSEREIEEIYNVWYAKD